jgi:hypothetical protein
MGVAGSRRFNMSLELWWLVAPSYFHQQTFALLALPQVSSSAIAAALVCQAIHLHQQLDAALLSTHPRQTGPVPIHYSHAWWFRNGLHLHNVTHYTRFQETFRLV